MSRREFEACSIRQLFREFVIAKRQREREQQRDVSLAWHTVAIYFKTKADKKMPSLHSLLKKTEKPVPQTVSQQRAMLQMISSYYKIPLRKAPKLIRRNGEAV